MYYSLASGPGYKASISLTWYPQDFLENELRPVMEPTVSKRNVGKVKQVWEQLHNQLQEWEEGSASSLYGEDTPTIEIGQLQKRFAKVCPPNNVPLMLF